MHEYKNIDDWWELTHIQKPFTHIYYVSGDLQNIDIGSAGIKIIENYIYH